VDAPNRGPVLSGLPAGAPRVGADALITNDVGAGAPDGVAPRLVGAFATRRGELAGTVRSTYSVRRTGMVKKILEFVTLKWLWDRHKERR
jgi:hypothetical protein